MQVGLVKRGVGLLRYMVSLYRLLHRQLLRPDDTGHMLLNRGKQRQERIGGVRYTAKHGIIYGAERLLADVRDRVTVAKETRQVESSRVVTH